MTRFRFYHYLNPRILGACQICTIISCQRNRACRDDYRVSLLAFKPAKNRMQQGHISRWRRLCADFPKQQIGTKSRLDLGGRTQFCSLRTLQCFWHVCSEEIELTKTSSNFL